MPRTIILDGLLWGAANLGSAPERFLGATDPVTGDSYLFAQIQDAQTLRDMAAAVFGGVHIVSADAVPKDNGNG